MKNPLLYNKKNLIAGSYKAIAGARARAELFIKSEPERKQIVSAPQRWLRV
jgi:hypothetical protein